MTNSPRWKHKFEIKPSVWVFVPNDQTISTGRNIKKNIEEKWKPPKNYYNHQKGGHLAAIRKHKENDLFFKADLKGFFNRINKSRVTRSLKRYFSYEESRRIACLSTVVLPNSNPKTYILPYGFVQSPIIASLCLYSSRLGKLIRKIEKDPDLKVSIYVDDIIVSCTAKNMDKLESTFIDFKDAAERSAFPLNNKKTIEPSSRIESFNINLEHSSTSITDTRMAQFIEQYTVSENANSKRSIKNYIKQVNLSQSLNLP